MRTIISSILFFILLSINLSAQQNLTQFVDPFIGTDAHGHTYPGATVPFGMVQLSPDTDTKGWDWCSGYHSSDSSMLGFSHTHLSGTGGADMGDILFMPTTGKIVFEPGSKENPDSGYRSRFSHENEKASPGYYSVFLDDYNIKADLTTSKRVGFHRYKYSITDSANVLIDLNHGISDITKKGYIKVIDEYTLEGYRNSAGWASDHTVYFYAKFNKPIKSYLIQGEGELIDTSVVTAEKVKAGFVFDLGNSAELLVKVGISFVSNQNAKLNLETEIDHWNFDKVAVDADINWNNDLNAIEVEGGIREQKRVFYTSLYHALIVPNIFEDVNGEYIGMDKQIYQSNDYTHYTLFSLWDTYRATHPLYTIIQQKRTKDFIQSMYNMSLQQGFLPIWELQSNETGTMIGYHAVSVIADAYLKGIEIPNIEEVYEQMIITADKDERGLKDYKAMDYIPMDRNDDAASRTIEYSYNDWTIAQVAKKLGKMDDYNRFINRSMNYRNLFDTTTGFIRGRLSDGRWKKDFYPEEPFPLGNGEFTEGNSWQYTWSGLHDINSLVELMGGGKAFEETLDSLFKAPDNPKFMTPADVTGLIGQYAHGNEPSHHVAYLYNYIGKPYKTQQRVRQIMDELYNDTRGGLCGNEDCGQMSAWYVFSAMGFYPVTPGSDKYIIGSPIFDKVTINLENGNKFVVKSINNSKENIYAKSINKNGESYLKSYLTHSDILNRGAFVFNMSKKPDYNYASSSKDRPVVKVEEEFTPIEEKFIFKPYVDNDRVLFSDNIRIGLYSANNNAKIYYTLNETTPNENSHLYENTIVSDTSFTLKAISYVDGLGISEVFEQRYSKALIREDKFPLQTQNEKTYPAIELKYPHTERYNGGSPHALIDGIKGSTNFLDGKWQGFLEVDLHATIDLGEKTDVNRVTANFMRDQGSWIFLPKEINFSISSDGKTFDEIQSIKCQSLPEHNEKMLKGFSADIKEETRFIRVIAKNLVKNPDWHYAAGNNAFIFADEITIEKK